MLRRFSVSRYSTASGSDRTTPASSAVMTILGEISRISEILRDLTEFARARAAGLLAINLSTLYRRLKRYEEERE